MRQLVAETVAFLLLAAAAYFFGWQRLPPNNPPSPAPPALAPKLEKRKPFLPWRWEEAVETVTLGGSISPDGKSEVTCDLPSDQLKRNIASRGLGCCVFRSLEYAARWQNVPALYDFPEWMIENKVAGGGYPAKADDLIAKISQSRGLPSPQYVNVETDDPAILIAALKSGRMPSITYNGRDPHYRGQIAHMTNLVFLDDQMACVRDNNFIGPNDLVWMTKNEFLSRWKGGQKQGWAVILLAPPPPPPPRNNAP